MQGKGSSDACRLGPRQHGSSYPRILPYTHTTAFMMVPAAHSPVTSTHSETSLRAAATRATPTRTSPHTSVQAHQLAYLADPSSLRTSPSTACTPQPSGELHRAALDHTSPRVASGYASRDGFSASMPAGARRESRVEGETSTSTASQAFSFSRTGVQDPPVAFARDAITPVEMKKSTEHWSRHYASADSQLQSVFGTGESTRRAHGKGRLHAYPENRHPSNFAVSAKSRPSDVNCTAHSAANKRNSDERQHHLSTHDQRCTPSDQAEVRGHYAYPVADMQRQHVSGKETSARFTNAAFPLAMAARMPEEASRQEVEADDRFLLASDSSRINNADSNTGLPTRPARVTEAVSQMSPPSSWSAEDGRRRRQIEKFSTAQTHKSSVDACALKRSTVMVEGATDDIAVPLARRNRATRWESRYTDIVAPELSPLSTPSPAPYDDAIAFSSATANADCSFAGRSVNRSKRAAVVEEIDVPAWSRSSLESSECALAEDAVQRQLDSVELSPEDWVSAPSPASSAPPMHAAESVGGLWSVDRACPAEAADRSFWEVSPAPPSGDVSSPSQPSCQASFSAGAPLSGGAFDDDAEGACGDGGALAREEIHHREEVHVPSPSPPTPDRRLILHSHSPDELLAAQTQWPTLSPPLPPHFGLFLQTEAAARAWLEMDASVQLHHMACEERLCYRVAEAAQYRKRLQEMPPHPAVGGRSSDLTTPPAHRQHSPEVEAAPTCLAVADGAMSPSTPPRCSANKVRRMPSVPSLPPLSPRRKTSHTADDFAEDAEEDRTMDAVSPPSLNGDRSLSNSSDEATLRSSSPVQPQSYNEIAARFNNTWSGDAPSSIATKQRSEYFVESVSDEDDGEHGDRNCSMDGNDDDDKVMECHHADAAMHALHNVKNHFTEEDGAEETSEGEDSTAWEDASEADDAERGYEEVDDIAGQVDHNADTVTGSDSGEVDTAVGNVAEIDHDTPTSAFSSSTSPAALPEKATISASPRSKNATRRSPPLRVPLRPLPSTLPLQEILNDEEDARYLLSGECPPPHVFQRWADRFLRDQRPPPSAAAPVSEEDAEEPPQPRDGDGEPSPEADGRAANEFAERDISETRRSTESPEVQSDGVAGGRFSEEERVAAHSAARDDGRSNSRQRLCSERNRSWMMENLLEDVYEGAHNSEYGEVRGTSWHRSADGFGDGEYNASGRYAPDPKIFNEDGCLRQSASLLSRSDDHDDDDHAQVPRQSASPDASSPSGILNREALSEAALPAPSTAPFESSAEAIAEADALVSYSSAAAAFEPLACPSEETYESPFGSERDAWQALMDDFIEGLVKLMSSEV